jgi:hypothetical protein
LEGQATQQAGQHLVFGGNRPAHIWLDTVNPGAANTQNLYFSLQSGGKNFVFGQSAGTYTQASMVPSLTIATGAAGASTVTVAGDLVVTSDLQVDGDHIGNNTDSDLLYLTANLLTVNGGGKFTTNLEIDGALNHDGSTVGFFGTTPATQASHLTNITGSDGSQDGIARGKINDILLVLERHGLMASS